MTKGLAHYFYHSLVFLYALGFSPCLIIVFALCLLSTIALKGALGVIHAAFVVGFIAHIAVHKPSQQGNNYYNKGSYNNDTGCR